MIRGSILFIDKPRGFYNLINKIIFSVTHKIDSIQVEVKALNKVLKAFLYLLPRDCISQSIVKLKHNNSNKETAAEYLYCRLVTQNHLHLILTFNLASNGSTNLSKTFTDG